MPSNPLLNPYRQAEDAVNNPLRPVSLDGFIGQDHLRERIVIALEAARRRNEMVDHLILSGPPGVGKTTLARIVATSLGGQLLEATGNSFRRPADLAGRLDRMKPHTVVFIDEIHALKRVVEETLYPAMEDGQIDLSEGRQSMLGGSAWRKNLPPFTLIGATTQAGQLSAPLRDRFGIDLRFELYGADDLTSIVKHSARILKVGLDANAAAVIASAARGTPRIANRLLRRVRDFALVRGHGNHIDLDAAVQTMALEKIDAHGLDEQDRLYLRTLVRWYKGGPAGVRALSASMNVAQATLEDVIEPFLLQQGLIVRTERGRKITPEGEALT